MTGHEQKAISDGFKYMRCIFVALYIMALGMLVGRENTADARFQERQPM